MKKIAIILAGGKGTRLWPLSRENYPKQFVEFQNGLSLFQLTVKRLLSVCKPEDIYIISQDNYKFTLYNQVELLNSLKSAEKKTIKKNIIFEPAPKNTLPAILLATKFIDHTGKLGDKDTIYVFPSDHFIEPLTAFKESMNKAQKLAEKDKIVVFGIKPTYPKEGYGYIVTKQAYHGGFLVDRFVEKPNFSKAQELINKGAFWNSGIFCFNKKVFLDELQKFEPKLHSYYHTSLNQLLNQFKNIPPNSIDYGIMQKTDKTALIRFLPRWTDLGSWDSYLQFLGENRENFSIGKAEFIDSAGCFTYSKNKLICAVGLKDVIAIDSADSLLLVKKGSSDRVKELVAHINQKGYAQSKDSNTVYRPWGYYTILHETNSYKVKEIGIYPKKSLSLQKHKQRSEHWNVVEGKMTVFLAGKEIHIEKNESVFVPKATRHKIFNPTSKIAKIIEVQIGSYLGEDDIIRYDSYK